MMIVEAPNHTQQRMRTSHAAELDRETHTAEIKCKK
jgi:hypothetical protein